MTHQESANSVLAKQLSGQEKVRILLGLAQSCRANRQRGDLEGAEESVTVFNKLLRGTCFGQADLPGLNKLSYADPDEVMKIMGMNLERFNNYSFGAPLGKIAME